MSTITQAEYEAMKARCDSARKHDADDSCAGPEPLACDKEAKLHAAILAYCQMRGMVALHGSMAHKTHRTPGEPDFIIFASRQTQYGQTPQVWLIECKSGKEKQSVEQLHLAGQLAKHGWTVYVVRSLREFVKVVEG